MEILIKQDDTLRNRNRASIYFNGKIAREVVNEMLYDAPSLGHEIKMIISENNQLNELNYIAIEKKLNLFLGYKKGKGNQMVYTSIHKLKGDTIKIECERAYETTNFAVENSTGWIYSNIESIIEQIKKITDGTK